LDGIGVDRALDAESRGRVLKEQIDPLFQSPLRLLGHVFNAALVVAVLWGEMSGVLLTSWLATVAVVAFTRIAICYAYQRRRLDGDDPGRWASLFFMGTLAAGLAWGAASFVVWLHPSFVAHAFVAFVIGGTTAAVAMITYAHLPSLYGFLLFGGVPVAANLMLKGGGVYLAMGAMVLLFIVLAMGYARRANSILTRSLVLGEINQALVADLSAARDSLEERVRERTAELDQTNASLLSEMDAHKETENRLRQAQKMEAVGQLTGGIAHDFNNLLAVILGNLELAGDKGIMEGPYSKEMAAVTRAAERGAQLTRQLLAFSRKQTLQPVAVEVNDLITSMIQLLERTLGESIEIRFVPVGGDCVAFVDASQLENAILNLAINARDAMGDGGTLTIVSATGTGHPPSDSVGSGEDRVGAPPIGPYILVAVSDTGTGITKADMDKVWEPFFTTKEVGEGSGLGLSMVYGFVKQSGGQVDIQSAEGEGTTVKLYLPAVERQPGGA
jgi:signal transduction histidine kinase